MCSVCHPPASPGAARRHLLAVADLFAAPGGSPWHFVVVPGHLAPQTVPTHPRASQAALWASIARLELTPDFGLTVEHIDVVESTPSNQRGPLPPICVDSRPIIGERLSIYWDRLAGVTATLDGLAAVRAGHTPDESYALADVPVPIGAQIFVCRLAGVNKTEKMQAVRYKDLGKLTGVKLLTWAGCDRWYYIKGVA